jgi:sugar lactone lactonase YvrE
VTQVFLPDEIGAVDWLRLDPGGALLLGEPGRVVRLSSSATILDDWRLPSGAGGHFDVDADGALFVPDAAAGRVLKVVAGSVVREWTGLAAPRGVAVDGQGGVWVLSDNNQVQHFGADGAALGSWRLPGVVSSAASGPFVGPGGSILIGDPATHRVLAYSAEGQPLGQWGLADERADRLEAPSGVAVDGDGSVWIADGGRVVHFDPSGVMLSGGEAPSEFGAEWAVDGLGNTWVADAVGNSVVVYGVDGEVVLSFGPGSGVGEFAGPRSVAVGADGAVYVADTGNRRVQVFR